jgi:hypothetical protein
MALAILEAVAFDKRNARFRVDTGTNEYYQIKFGRAVQQRNGIDWVDEVFHSSPLKRNPSAGDRMGSWQTISLPAPDFDGSSAYVQLLSFKTPAGKSPAFSRVLRMHPGIEIPDGAPFELESSLGWTTSMRRVASFQEPRRRVPWASTLTYSRQTSLDSLLEAAVKLAAPIALQVLKDQKNGSSSSSGGTGQSDVLAQLLGAILGSLGGGAAPAISNQQSTFSSRPPNRFTDLTNYSQPFSPALLAALPGIIGAAAPIASAVAGPVAQVLPALAEAGKDALPALINAITERRLKLTQANHNLISDITAGINQRLLLEKLAPLQAQPAAGAAPVNAADLNQLIQLLQQLPPASEKTADTKSAAAVTQSLALSSTRAVLSFKTNEPVLWNGTAKTVFAKDRPLQLKIQLNVGEPVPKTPLPKAIIKVVFKRNGEQSVLFEKTFRQKNVMPNTELALQFSPEELGPVKTNECLAVLAEMRWLSPKTGREHKALGSSEIVLTSRYFVKQQGTASSAERELTDLKQFRSFWNKIWESPTLDHTATGGSGSRKSLWELNADAKYTVLLSTQESNGLMETKLLRGPVNEESLSERTEGRMKSGIELSVSELNKLLPLWDGASPLEKDKLDALNTDAFGRTAAGEFVANLRLKGKARDRGMVWVVPVLKLFNIQISSVAATDDAGQVVSVNNEDIRFPLPVSARIIGLKSLP